MLHLTNDNLTIDILDPVADRARLGSRYCAGGYVWQVTDRAHGPRLVGPEWPHPEPDPFNGQGLPDAFETAPGADDVPVGGEVLVLGVGMVRRDSETPYHPRKNPHVASWATWEVETSPDRITMRTQQAHRDWAFTLTRTVALEGRTLAIGARIQNTGAPLPLRWFAHPFFPRTPDDRYCRFAPPAALPDNPAYTRDADGWVHMRTDYDWAKGGWFQPLEIAAGEPLTGEQHTPAGLVRVTCDFPVASLPIWANDRTFSWEPYLDTTVAPGAEVTWGMRYAW
jgi:hypothetical protein